MTVNPVMMRGREYFALVVKRLGMYVRGSTLAGVEGFLDGYDQHAKRHGGPGLHGWREWLAARLGRGHNLVWDWLVRHIALPTGWDEWELTPEDESRVIEVLFELLDEFLAERERLEAQAP